MSGAIDYPDDHEMLRQLWFAVLGSNGDGLASSVKRNTADIAILSQRSNDRAVECPRSDDIGLLRVDVNKLFDEKNMHAVTCPRSTDIKIIKEDVQKMMTTPGKIALKILGILGGMILTGAFGWMLAKAGEHLAK
jgi:hypothetical protein